jgi:hypothetical protein
MPKKQTVPQQRVETRSKNKATHPGKVDKPAQRRTKEEVKQEKEAKAQAKKTLAEARQQSINRAAEFEHANIANEDMVDATPRPTFIPKPRPLSLKRKNSPLTSLPNTSDVEADDVDDSPFIANSESLPADTDDSSMDVESDGPPAPPTKKGETTPKATAAKKRGTTNVETDPDEEAPKPKRAKAKMRDEINVATTKIVENAQRGLGNKYAKMVDSVPSHSSQFQGAGGRPLKREGAIADIGKLVRGGNKSTSAAGTGVADINFPVSSMAREGPENNVR